jgi:hypothetical protein
MTRPTKRRVTSSQRIRIGEADGAGGRFQLGRHAGDLFSTRATNTLIVKLAYWLNR